MRNNNTSDFNWLQPIVFFISPVLILRVVFVFLCPIRNVPLKEPEVKEVHPKEMPIVTMEMNYTIIYEALTSDVLDEISVNNPKGLLTNGNLNITDNTGKLIDSQVAEDTAGKYPKLFRYDPETNEFTVREVHPGKNYIIVPAWLVERLIVNGALKL